MRSNLPTVLAVSLGLFFLASISSAADRGSKHDADVDFDSYRTYRWNQTHRPTFPILEPGGEVDSAIRTEIDERLQKVGLEKVDEGEAADLLLSYDAAAVSDMQSDVVRREVVQGVSWVVDGSIRSYVDATLVITLNDAETEKPVWSGWSGRRMVVDDGLAAKARKSARRIMRHYPPK